MKSDLSKTPVDWSAFEQELLEAVYSVLIEKNQRANQKLGTLYDEKEGIWEKYREFFFVEDGALLNPDPSLEPLIISTNPHQPRSVCSASDAHVSPIHSASVLTNQPCLTRLSEILNGSNDGSGLKNLLEDGDRKIAEREYQIGFARILQVKNSAIETAKITYMYRPLK